MSTRDRARGRRRVGGLSVGAHLAPGSSLMKAGSGTRVGSGRPMAEVSPRDRNGRRWAPGGATCARGALCRRSTGIWPVPRRRSAIRVPRRLFRQLVSGRRVADSYRGDASVSLLGRRRETGHGKNGEWQGRGVARTCHSPPRATCPAPPPPRAAHAPRATRPAPPPRTLPRAAPAPRTRRGPGPPTRPWPPRRPARRRRSGRRASG